MIFWTVLQQKADVDLFQQLDIQLPVRVSAHSLRFDPSRLPFKPVRGSQRAVTAAEANAAPLLQQFTHTNWHPALGQDLLKRGTLSTSSGLVWR